MAHISFYLQKSVILYSFNSHIIYQLLPSVKPVQFILAGIEERQQHYLLRESSFNNRYARNV